MEIENALRRRVLVLKGLSDEEESVILMHPDFRLFATQNPAGGIYEGVKNQFSELFLSNWQVINVGDISVADKETIAAKILATGWKVDADTPAITVLARKVVSFHEQIMIGGFSDEAGRPYAQFSLRD